MFNESRKNTLPKRFYIYELLRNSERENSEKTSDNFKMKLSGSLLQTNIGNKINSSGKDMIDK